MTSHNIVHWAWKVSGLSTSKRLVLLAIACQCDDHGRTYARRSTLADRCEIDPSQISRHLKSLEEAGLISRGENFIQLTPEDVRILTKPVRKLTPTREDPHEPSSSSTASGSSETPPPPPWGSLPPDLDTDDVKSALREYHQHRREKKNLPTAVSWRRLIAKLKKWGPKRSVEAIEHSLANGWTGVFLPDENGSGRDVVADHGAYGTGHDPREDFR